MFCMKCGTELPDGSRFCPYCGVVFEDIFRKDKGLVMPSDEEIENAPINSECVVGFTLACISLVVRFFYLFNIIALVTSAVSLVTCYNKKMRGRGFAYLGILISILSTYCGVHLSLVEVCECLNRFV